MRYSLFALIVGSAMLLGVDIARAEVFLLTNGGRVVGELVNRDETPRKKYVVELEDGGRVTLEASQVETVQRPKPEVLEYEKIRSDYPDTAEGQWALAEWCREKKLPAQRDAALKRIIELDPDHADARHALGYNKIGGKWARQKDLMEERGYVYYKGRWMLPQEVEQLAEKAKRDALQAEWSQKVGRWRRWLGTKRDDEAKGEFRKIDDPAALGALVRALRDERTADVRLILIEAITKFDTPESERALAIAAVQDESDEVRMTCLDFLKTKRRPEAVSYFVSKLSSKKSDNPTINLAGVALREMKDPSATGPLIDALSTTHKFKVGGGGGPGSISPTFSNGPGGSGSGLNMNSGPKFVYQTFNNQGVLDALVAITGQNFSWDKTAWKAWFDAQKQPQTLEGRRN
jgi:hypothetical protein